MADYLNKIAAAKADIARLKGEKEAFEQSNAPDDTDEEELVTWNYARDLERQTRELKVEHKDALKALARLERAAARARATDADRRAAAEAKAALQPVFDRFASSETELAPYECVKAQLAEARATLQQLTNALEAAKSGRTKKEQLAEELAAIDTQIRQVEDNAAGSGIVELTIDPPAEGWSGGFPIRPRSVLMALEDPDGFLAALGAPGGRAS